MNMIIDNNSDLIESLSNTIFKSKYRVVFLFAVIYKSQDIYRVINNIRNKLMYHDFKKTIKSNIFYYLLKLPSIKNKVDNKISEFNSKIETDFKHNQQKLNYNFGDSLPWKGYASKEIINKLFLLRESNTVNQNQVSGTLYNDKEELELIKNVFPIFYKSNPLHPDIFPEISVLEKNIIKIASKLFNGDENTCGCMTSGGTESILMACYAYKNIGLQK